MSLVHGELDSGIRCVSTAGTLRGRDLAPTLALLDRLSAREREVLLLIASAYSDAEIATRLSISHRTVRAHVSAIFEKLAIGSRVEAAIVGTTACRTARPGLLCGGPHHDCHK
ncbi:helix-turn-helix domain-containing protein [Embleya sp. AB8]|uniref:helix-turn-helix domain-containing protein n=1 Tax=Embleya sp. AB8 TaxID=3156304 RepID=UPI003C718D4D